MKYHFEWDPHKAKINLNKHKVSFEEAANVFLDSNALSIYDEDHSDREERWITSGLAQTGKLLVVSHTYHWVSEKEAQVRIISCRKATVYEQNQYKEVL